MGILSNIFSKIFPSSHAAGAPPAPLAPPAGTGAAGTAGTITPGAAAPPTSVTSTAAATVPMPEVDVEKQLDDMVAKSPEKLNWKTSIADLMKLLGLDSSLQARKDLAKELHYTGDTNDSASMNIWLHRQVMTKIAANGGKVPADLKD
ncbi:DUF3597 domain-containing protein [Variovorax sp. dw_954]|uniref:DUF3597 domain-containing protein n=1 Tax=Variovorax sp. dw_954 TaxID=2720078 RepID=UPI001BD5BD8E|nr:DUF3597 domain-containing protein [Variovorax sp. dw_954]